MISVGGEGEALCSVLVSLTLWWGRGGRKGKEKKRKRKVSFGGSSAIGNEDPLCSLAERKRCLILTRIAFKIKLFYLQACRAPQTLFGLLEGKGRHKMKICFIVGLSANKRLLKERQTKRVPGGGLPRWAGEGIAAPVRSRRTPGKKLGNKLFLLVNPPVSFPRPRPSPK